MTALVLLHQSYGLLSLLSRQGRRPNAAVADLNQQLEDRGLRDANHATGGPDTGAFVEGLEDGGLLGEGERVHGVNIGNCGSGFYDRLAPKVREELKRLTPRDASGRHEDRLHQRLTADIGHPRLREHLTAVIALMRVSPDYDVLEMLLNAAMPLWDDTLSLPLDTISVLPRLNALQRVPKVATGEAGS